MDDREYGYQLQDIGSSLKDMVQAVAVERSIPSAELRRVLKFISKVIEVVDQAFRDVYAALIDFKYLKLSDLDPGRKEDLQKQLDLLLARDRYRNAQQICTRLHYLSEEYDEQIDPIVSHLPHSQSWSEIFYLLSEYEGRIIILVEETVWDLRMLLDNATDASSIPSIRQTAAERAESIRKALVNLEALQDRILGVSGEQGFLELTETDREKLEKQVIEPTV